MAASHRITRENGKVRVHGLEVFMAFDPSIDDAKADPRLAKWTNERVRKSVEKTLGFMARGSRPQFIVRHDLREGEPGTPPPPEAVGVIMDLWTEERGGVAYAVCDAEFTEEKFAAYIESNAYPRRSAEFWADNDHMSEVALLGRETPRRPLPDTHFARRGAREQFSAKLRFSYTGAGGGGNTFVPASAGKDDKMTVEERIGKLEAAVEEMAKCLKIKHSADMTGDSEGEAGKAAMAKPAAAPAPEGDGLIRAELDAAKTALEAMKEQFKQVEQGAKRERFGRQLDDMIREGVAIKDEAKAAILERIVGSEDPDAEVAYIKSNFARLPINTEIPVGKAALPKTKLTMEQIREKAEEFAKKGDIDGYHKWVRENQ